MKGKEKEFVVFCGLLTVVKLQKQADGMPHCDQPVELAQTAINDPDERTSLQNNQEAGLVLRESLILPQLCQSSSVLIMFC